METRNSPEDISRYTNVELIAAVDAEMRRIMAANQPSGGLMAEISWMTETSQYCSWSPMTEAMFGERYDSRDRVFTVEGYNPERDVIRFPWELHEKSYNRDAAYRESIYRINSPVTEQTMRALHTIFHIAVGEGQLAHDRKTKATTLKRTLETDISMEVVTDLIATKGMHVGIALSSDILTNKRVVEFEQCTNTAIDGVQNALRVTEYYDDAVNMQVQYFIGPEGIIRQSLSSPYRLDFEGGAIRENVAGFIPPSRHQQVDNQHATEFEVRNLLAALKYDLGHTETFETT